MSVLRAAPFNLAKGDKIIVRGMAANIKGFNTTWSSTSNSGFSTVVETEPDAPSAPLNGADTKFNVLHTYWSNINNYFVVFLEFFSFSDY